MKLTVLGSGSCMVKQQERAPSGYVLQDGDASILIDTGTGITQNMPEAGIDVRDLDAIINTHRHPDHVSDLVPIVQDKIVRSGSQKEPGIALYGPEGHREYLGMRLSEEVPVRLKEFKQEFGFGLGVVEMEGKTELPGGFAVEVQEADHGPEDFVCLSLRIEKDDRSIVFTGDTDYHEGLSEFSAGADLLVTDCSKPDELKAEGHMTPTESAKIAEKAGVEKLLLSHLYPEIEDYNIVETASGVFDGEIEKAEDLMVLEF